jgi:pilus assembly protein Flp/PilA
MSKVLLNLYLKVQTSISGDEGQNMVEYALIVALIAFGATVAMSSLGNGLNNAFTNISSQIANSLT